MSYPEHPGGPYPPREGQSQYPPPPSDDDRARAYHARGPPPQQQQPVTLPSIASPYEQPYGHPANGYDPRGYAPQDPYRNPPPMQQMGYRDDRAYGGGQGDYGRMPQQQHQQQMAFTQSAPRQRTAIACRYCRRRKIRCSGFDQSPEGRCSNCQRFQQECIFTPVSSQAQAFVPAHAAFPHMRPGNMTLGPDGRPRQMYPQPQLYGAHGQPLGPLPPGVPMQQGVGMAQGQPHPGYEYAIPSPTSSHGGSYGGYADEQRRSAGPSGHHGAQGQETRKRPSAEAHHGVLPPPVPGQGGSGAGGAYEGMGVRRRASGDPEVLKLPPVTARDGQATSNYSPGSSTSSTSALQMGGQHGGHEGLPVLTRTPPPRTSPSMQLQAEQAVQAAQRQAGQGEQRQGEQGRPERGERADPMAIGNIMEQRPVSDVDSKMLGRLNRKN